MTRKAKSNTTWTLTVLRNGEQGASSSLEAAEFRFGRTKDEVLRSPVSTAPPGVISAIKESNLEDVALESGVLIEMRPRAEKGWLQFDSIVTLSQGATPSEFGPNGPSVTYSRALFISIADDSILEFIDLSSPFVETSRMPKQIWIRAFELPIERLAWAVENGVFEGLSSEQATLDQWFTFEGEAKQSRPPEFTMPGPVD